jgi:hypothetical protein
MGVLALVFCARACAPHGEESGRAPNAAPTSGAPVELESSSRDGDAARDRVAASSAVDREVLAHDDPFDEDLVLVVEDERGALVAGADIEVLESWPQAWIADVCADAALGARASTHVVTDERGRARVPRAAQGRAVRVRADRLAGFEVIAADIASPHVVLVARLDDVQIRVRDEHGEPFADLALSVGRPNDVRPLWSGVTDARGAVVLDASWLEASNVDDALQVVVDVPAVPVIERWITFHPWGRQATDPAPRTELVVARGDDVLVRLVDDRGELVALDGELLFAPERSSETGIALRAEGPQVRARVQRGVARVRGLARSLGDLHAALAGDTWEWTKLAHTAGVPWPPTLEFALAANRTAARVLVRDEHGEPARDFRLARHDAVPNPDPGDAAWFLESKLVTSDARGEFTLVVRDDDEPPGIRARFVDASSTPPRAGELVLAAGERVGELRLAPSEVVLAGRVVDAAGAPVGCARLDIVAADEGRAPTLDLPVVTDARGRFTAFGAGGSSALRVDVMRDGQGLELAAADVPPFAAGARDVIVRVASAGFVDGLVLLRDPRDTSAFDVSVLDAGGSILDAVVWPDAGGLRFRAKDLDPGPCTVRVRVGDVSSPPFEIADVNIVAGRVTHDPRLWPLDLRTLPPVHSADDELADVALQPLLITDADGNSLDHGLWTLAFDDTRWRWAQPWAGGAVRIYPPMPHLAVWSPGCFVREGPLVRGTTTWSLERAARIELVLGLPDELRAPSIEFYARLRVEREDSPIARSLDTRNVEWINFDARGRAQVDIPEAGRWAVFVSGIKRIADDDWISLGEQELMLDVADAQDTAPRTLKPDTARWIRVLQAGSSGENR